jgi:hypothetical protein
MDLAVAAEFGIRSRRCFEQAEVETFESCQAVIEQGLRVGNT